MSTVTSYERPRLRWWLPGAQVEDHVLTEQLESVQRAGFGGVEVAWLGLGAGKGAIAEEYLFGSQRWKDSFKHIVAEGERLGLHVDFTISASFPCIVPGLLPSSDGAAVELVSGTVLLHAGEHFSGPLPVPPEAPSGQGRALADLNVPLNLLVVHAVRVKLNDKTAVPGFRGPWQVSGDAATAVQVLDLKDGQVTFTAPREGDDGVGYVLMASYWRGNAQHKSIWEGFHNDVYTTPRGVVPDHFGSAGVTAVEEFYDRELFTPELRETFKRLQSSVFEDSLELHYAQYWTPTFISAFHQYRGYDLVPFLPFLHEHYRPTAFTPHTSIVTTKTVDGGEEVETVRRLIHDFKATLSELYLAQHVRPLVAWANKNGLKFRCQPYEMDFDAGLIASQLDIVEGETLIFGKNRDAFRLLASGRDVAGKTILSDELGANMFQVYEVSWKRLIEMANLNFALGVNQVVLHGLPYPDSPSATWPGYMPFEPGPPLPSFSEAWGDRTPQWEFASICTEYLARTQSILQSGHAVVDVAIYHPALHGIAASWPDVQLNAHGYSYGFLTDGLLGLPTALVRDGRLFPDGPGYQALIVDSQHAMELVTARKIVELAQNGLPIIVVGQWPVTTPGLHPDNKQSSADEELLQLGKTLQLLPHCTAVPERVEVARAIAAQSIPPLVTYSRPEDGLITICRQNETERWYYIYNDGDAPSSQSIRLGKGSPTLLDPWTGKVSACDTRVDEHDQTVVSVVIQPKATALICLDTKEKATPNAMETISEQRIDLENWTLEVEEWSPANPAAVGVGASSTTKTKLPVIRLPSLQSWSTIPGLESAAGIGLYRTLFTLPSKQSVKLSFPSDQDCALAVRLNGHNVPGDAIGQNGFELGPYLQERNDLEIRVGTTLVNKVKQLYPAKYEKRPQRQYGLLGASLSYYK